MLAVSLSFDPWMTPPYTSLIGSLNRVGLDSMGPTSARSPLLVLDEPPLLSSLCSPELAAELVAWVGPTGACSPVLAAELVP